jgi:hypothetical protein
MTNKTLVIVCEATTVKLVPFSIPLFGGYTIPSDELQNLTFFQGGGGRGQRAERRQRDWPQ